MNQFTLFAQSAITLCFFIIPLITLLVTSFFYIIKKQTYQKHKQKLLTQQLILGAHITTYNNKKGFILHVLYNTVIIETDLGTKHEIHKLAIRSVKPSL